jgi:hypothetical protein
MNSNTLKPRDLAKVTRIVRSATYCAPTPERQIVNQPSKEDFNEHSHEIPSQESPIDSQAESPAPSQNIGGAADILTVGSLTQKILQVEKLRSSYSLRVFSRSGHPVAEGTVLPVDCAYKDRAYKEKYEEEGQVYHVSLKRLIDKRIAKCFPGYTVRFFDAQGNRIHLSTNLKALR